MRSIRLSPRIAAESSRGGRLDGQRVNGGFAAIVDRAGRFVASRSSGLTADPEVLNQTRDIDLGPDNRLAIAGRFTGVADLGEGPIESGVDPPQAGVTGYIAVYAPEPTSVDSAPGSFAQSIGRPPVKRFCRRPRTTSQALSK